MRLLWIGWLLAAAQGSPALAQVPKPSAAAQATSPADINVLKGAWVRPDGGYVIQIKGVGADGTLDAMYFNPSPLPFAVARAGQDGAILRVSLELRAGGYGGSTYELAYDPATDRVAVSGPVTLNAADGFQLMVRNVAINLRTRTMTSDEPVSGRLPIGSFSANSFRADIETRRVSLRGNVRTRLIARP